MKTQSHPFVTPTAGSPWLPASAGTLLGAAATWLGESFAGWRTALQRARHQRGMRPPGRPKGEFRRAQPEGTPLSLLDDATLRDLGLRRSEIGSVLAEAAGEAEMTRLRVTGALGPSVIRM